MKLRSPLLLTSRALLLLSLAALGLSGCNENKNTTDGLLSNNGKPNLSVWGNIRPSVDPNMVAKIRQEEQDERLKKQREWEEANQQELKEREQAREALDPANRDLPPVDQTPFAANGDLSGVDSTAAQMAALQAATASSIPMPPSQPPQSVASYGGGYGTPPPGGSLIPPPPAVSLSTQAAPYPPSDPYANNPYAGYNPYAQPPPAVSGHPSGSMFSNTSQAPTITPAEEPKKKSLVVITPTGMEPRSPYQQRDDLRMLVKSAFANTSVKELREGKVAKALSRLDVHLPAGTSRGNVNLTQRQVDNLFDTQSVDPKASLVIKKIESDTAQSYYRYLAAFNRYTLTQQQITARKQEMDAADDDSERQRAASDLATAQTDAEAAKEDLDSSQADLASLAGSQAAGRVIYRVSGIAPETQQLGGPDTEVAQAQAPAKSAKKSGGMHFELFGGRDKKERNKKEAPGRSAPAASDTHQTAAAPSEKQDQPEDTSKAADSAPTSGIAFQLKNVETLRSKSVLKVAIRNNSSDSVSIDPDSISVAEGNRKLSDGAIRSEFDATTVGPNQEITGTITIFGRPWNDRLSVSLNDQGKTIALKH